jgi:hypothetical protein
MPKHRVLAGAAVELCPEGTLGREPVSTQSADKGRNHEENAAAAGRPCHARRDQRGLFERRACKELQPPGSFSAHLSPKQLSAALKFARCIRANGVKDFPDPVNGEPLVDTTKIPSTDRPGGLSILNAAMRKCRQFGPEAAGGQG